VCMCVCACGTTILFWVRMTVSLHSAISGTGDPPKSTRYLLTYPHPRPHPAPVRHTQPPFCPHLWLSKR
jgi:hypothetical protein